MIGWISLSRILWTMKNKMKIKEPEMAFFIIHANFTGNIQDKEGNILLDFNSEKELDDKLTYLQRGGSVNGVGPGKVLPKSIKREPNKKKEKSNAVYIGFGNSNISAPFTLS